MNIKSFFNPTILKKDLTRFLPLWVIYLIMGLLLAVSNMGQFYSDDARQLGESLQWLSVVLCLYALIAAQLLFGELFQGRMCNAVHALPVRREGLFLSHFTAGMIMGIGPNVIIALVSMLTMGRLWFVALLWLAGAAMMYLLFFGMAVFCMLCSGNRFGGIALYALVNFLGVIVMWFYGSFYLPMLYGMELTSSTKAIFYVFSPVVKMAEENDWFHFGHYLYSPSGSGGLHVGQPQLRAGAEQRVQVGVDQQLRVAGDQLIMQRLAGSDGMQHGAVRVGAQVDGLACIARQAAVGPHAAVAWDDDGDGIGPHGLAHRLGGHARFTQNIRSFFILLSEIVNGTHLLKGRSNKSGDLLKYNRIFLQTVVAVRLINKSYVIACDEVCLKTCCALKSHVKLVGSSCTEDKIVFVVVAPVTTDAALSLA